MAWELAMIMMFGFILKHTIVDFWLQPPWMWMNKHRFGHPGGVAHSLLHAVATGFLLWPFAEFLDQFSVFNWKLLLYLTCTTELIVHYFTDLCKMKICAWRGWKANTSPWFWYMLGLDQLIHMLTYWIIVVGWIGISTMV